MTSTEKDHALSLLDRLDAVQRGAALRFMEFLLLDSVARTAATAPADDEPVTEEDRRRVSEGRAWFAQRGGNGIPMAEVLAGFGLKMEDFPTGSESPQ